MKTLHTSILVGILMTGTWLMAGSVTIPNTFTANTTAKAAEVNANFTAVKNAVNDNDHEIGQNVADIATNKSDTNANKTAIGQKVAEVKVAGGLSVSRADGNVTLKLRDGYVAVNGSQFNSSDELNNRCIVRRYYSANLGIIFSASSTYNDCSAFADVQIPQGATIKKLTCRVKHNVVNDLHVKLMQQNRSYAFIPFPPTTGNIQRSDLIVATLDAAHGNTTDTQEVSGTYTPPPFLIMNPTYISYLIEWDPPATASAGANEMLFDCKVDYEY